MHAGPNRILAMVRKGETRTKEDFDELARLIEESWYEVVDRVDTGGAARPAGSVRGGEKLHLIFFYPMLAARENGVTLPGVSLVMRLVLYGTL